MNKHIACSGYHTHAVLLKLAQQPRRRSGPDLVITGPLKTVAGHKGSSQVLLRLQERHFPSSDATYATQENPSSQYMWHTLQRIKDLQASLGLTTCMHQAAAKQDESRTHQSVARVRCLCCSMTVYKAYACMMQVVDTTGAGDCFTGAVAVGILEGKSYQEAMKFAGKAM